MQCVIKVITNKNKVLTNNAGENLYLTGFLFFFFTICDDQNFSLEF